MKVFIAVSIPHAVWRFYLRELFASLDQTHLSHVVHECLKFCKGAYLPCCIKIMKSDLLETFQDATIYTQYEEHNYMKKLS